MNINTLAGKHRSVFVPNSLVLCSFDGSHKALRGNIGIEFKDFSLLDKNKSVARFYRFFSLRFSAILHKLAFSSIRAVSVGTVGSDVTFKISDDFEALKLFEFPPKPKSSKLLIYKNTKHVPVIFYIFSSFISSFSSKR